MNKLGIHETYRKKSSYSVLSDSAHLSTLLSRKRNIFVGDNEAGKSTVLHAVDIALTGSRAKVEILGSPEVKIHYLCIFQCLGKQKK